MKYSLLSRKVWRHHYMFLRCSWLECNQTVHQLFIDTNKDPDSFRREILHNILRDTEIPMKLIRPTEMCLNKNCTKSLKVNIFLIHFLFIRVRKKEMHYRH
jgi:hypothetical protein